MTEEEIEVTPEMIKAGKEAISRYDLSIVQDDLGYVVNTIFRAMASARVPQPEETAMKKWSGK